MAQARVREDIQESRAHTDESLGAERAGTDAATDRSVARARRVLDDIIERDRTLADERLTRFRAKADNVLARERADSPASDASMIVERHLADEGRKAEREVTDASLVRERHRADAFIETERRETEADRARSGSRRQRTDTQLSTERKDADVAVNTLDETSDALASAIDERARHDDVLGMVAHDLRNPLCIITMNARAIASEGASSGTTREAAEEMILVAARMDRLLMDLLDAARIESGTLRIDKKRYDVGALVTEIVNSYRPLFEDRELILVAELPGGEIVARFDHDRIVQVFSNLLGNAMKFTPAKGTVRLVVERTIEHVEFALRDDGPGIHPDALPHVFERFWQIASDERRGLGLGLHICRKIVEEHGGRIWVESELGRGSTFRFTLPT
jgi:signal transduction histidine kinase